MFGYLAIVEKKKKKNWIRIRCKINERNIDIKLKASESNS